MQDQSEVIITETLYTTFPLYKNRGGRGLEDGALIFFQNNLNFINFIETQIFKKNPHI